MTGNNHQEIEETKAYLHNSFSIKDLGKLHFFLGIEVNYFPDGITLSQNRFTKELLEEIDFNKKKNTTTPLPVNLKLSAQEGTLLDNPTFYRSIVGKLNYLTNTRPDRSSNLESIHADPKVFTLESTTVHIILH